MFFNVNYIVFLSYAIFDLFIDLLITYFEKCLVSCMCLVQGYIGKGKCFGSNSVLFHKFSLPMRCYMGEKTYHLSQYLGPFGAYFMPQGPK